MGDRTNMSGYLHMVPKGKAKKVAALLEEEGVAQDWDSYQRSPAWDAQTVRYIMENDIQFTDDQWTCGAGHDLAKKLRKLGVAFEFHEDPKYEWMGDLHMYHPELGQFYSTCDADGEVQISATEVSDLEKKYPKAGSRWVKLRERLGLDYHEAYFKLVRAEEEAV